MSIGDVDSSAGLIDTESNLAEPTLAQRDTCRTVLQLALAAKSDTIDTTTIKPEQIGQM